MLEFDHLPLGAFDIGAIRGHMERLGFTTTPAAMCRWALGGRAYAAASVSVVFPRGYLDLIETRDPAWQQHLADSPLYDRGMAPSGVVLSAPCFDEARSALQTEGIAVADSYEIVREMPGATPAEIHYRISSFRPGGLPLAIIEDSAPEAMRQQPWMSHANAAIGIQRFHLRVPSIDRALSPLAAVWTVRSASATTAEMDLGSAAMILHQTFPNDGYLKAVSQELPHPDRVALLAVEFAVSNLEKTRAHLRAVEISFTDLSDSIAVEPTAGYGCGIVFVSAGRPAITCS